MVQTNDTILEQDSTLNAFYADYQSNSTVVKMDELKERVLDLMHNEETEETYEALVTDIGNLTTGNTMEANMKNYIFQYVNHHFNIHTIVGKGESTDTVTAKEKIWDIAEQCIFEGGPSVLEARAFLTIDSLELLNHAWTDSCSTSGSSKKGLDDNKLKANEDEKVQATLDYRLIPNLLAGNRTATLQLGGDEHGYVEIFSITGIRMEIHRVAEGSNTLNLHELPSGVFIYKVTIGSEERNKDKLVILD